MERSGRAIRGHIARHQCRNTLGLGGFHDAEGQNLAGSRCSGNFVLRGGLFVLPMLSNEFYRVIRFIADPSEHLFDMITPPTENIGIVAFLVPIKQGTLAPRTPEVHFQVFVEISDQ